MANELSGPVWTLDTQGAGMIYNSPVYIKDIYWLNPATIGDVVTIQDKDGGVIKTMRCEVAAQSQEFLIESWFSGLKLPTLGSGTIYITTG